MTPRERARARARAEEARRFRAASTTVRDVVASLRDVRAVVIEQIAGMEGFGRKHRERVLAQIDTALANWEAKSQTALLAALQSAAGTGSDSILNVAKAHGVTGANGVVLTDAQVRAAVEHVSDQIKDISLDTRTKIDRVLRRAALSGTVTPLDVIREVAPLSGKGVFVSAAGRAESIVRTETARIAQTASQSMMGDMAKRGVITQKQWVSVGDDRTREAHLAADGQVVDVDEPFEVGGEELMFPGDPAGSPGNTINCRCVSVPYVEEPAE